MVFFKYNVQLKLTLLETQKVCMPHWNNATALWGIQVQFIYVCSKAVVFLKWSFGLNNMLNLWSIQNLQRKPAVASVS